LLKFQIFAVFFVTIESSDKPSACLRLSSFNPLVVYFFFGLFFFFCSSFLFFFCCLFSPFFSPFSSPFSSPSPFSLFLFFLRYFCLKPFAV